MNERSQEQECTYYLHEGGLTQIEPPDLYRTEQDIQQTSNVPVKIDGASLEIRT